MYFSGIVISNCIEIEAERVTPGYRGNMTVVWCGFHIASLELESALDMEC